MSSAASCLSAPLPPNNALRFKIESLISAATVNSSPRDAFLNEVWPSLITDYQSLVNELIAYFEHQLRSQAIHAKVEGRVKSPVSIAESIKRREKHRIENGKRPYSDVGEILQDVHDLAGTRIIVDNPADVDSVNDFITQTFHPTKQPSIFSADRKVGSQWAPWLGAYQSWNHPLKLKSSFTGELLFYAEITFEVQLTSLAESLYNRLSHPLLYKRAPGSISRKDEMVFDITHGLALCYSICLLCMQDQMDDPTGSADEQRELKDAMRSAAPPPGAEYTDDNIQPLVDILHDKGLLHEGQSGAFGSFSRASRRTLPVETLIAGLQQQPDLCKSTNDLQQWITKICRSVPSHLSIASTP